MTIPGRTPAPADRAMLRDLVLGRTGVDRAAHRRTDEAWLADAVADPANRVLLLREGRTPVARDADGAAVLGLVPAPDLADLDVPPLLLGVDDAGTAYLAAALPATGLDPEAALHDGDALPGPPGAEWLDLRAAGAVLGDRDAGLLVSAVALANWHATHPRCPRCGVLTVPAAAGWLRVCPDDGSEHYPRTDPAVIVLVRDADDRALLGRQHRWPAGWYSTLAGFVEAGETAESAVRREVLEESGVVIDPDPDALVYLGSQPWPFPSSLMLGYHALAATTAITVDGDELEAAGWFSREELADACARGQVRLPPSISIARKLVERWYGAPLPSDWAR